MTRFTATVAAVALSGAASLSVVIATPAVASGTFEGCPYGAVCIYPQNAGWNGGHPSLVFYSYGPHNLIDQLGKHYVFNNPSGGASSTLNKGYNGANPVWRINAFNYSPDFHMAPINSITLLRPGQ